MTATPTAVTTDVAHHFIDVRPVRMRFSCGGGSRGVVVEHGAMALARASGNVPEPNDSGQTPGKRQV
jgi:hypothetical protein